jgi:hypothetical protein
LIHLHPPHKGERKKSQNKSDGGSLTSEFVDFTQILDGSILSKLSSKHWRVVRFPVTTVAYNGRSFHITSHSVLANSATNTVIFLRISPFQRGWVCTQYVYLGRICFLTRLYSAALPNYVWLHIAFITLFVWFHLRFVNRVSFALRTDWTTHLSSTFSSELGSMFQLSLSIRVVKQKGSPFQVFLYIIPQISFVFHLFVEIIITLLSTPTILRINIF